jgi:excisionase family DNA binding protein
MKDKGTESPRKIGDTAIFTVDELAPQFGVKPSTIRRYIRQGRIAGRKVGNAYYITEKAINDFLNGPPARPEKEWPSY